MRVYGLGPGKEKLDTLNVWVQHLPENGSGRPNTQMVKRADIVVWCFPRRYPHEKHIFPDAKGLVCVFFGEKAVTIATKKAVRKSPRLRSCQLQASAVSIPMRPHAPIDFVGL